MSFTRPVSRVAGSTQRSPHHVELHSSHLRLGGGRLPLVAPARIYTCGITPYDVTHLGHAATFVWADVAAAAMGAAGVDAVVCRNVTDVDDVLTRAAGSRGRPYDEFALTQEFLFERDMRALRVKAPTHAPRARHHITGVMQLAAALLATGRAYEREGNVYFRGADVPARAGVPDALRLSEQCGDQPDDPLRDDPFDVPVWRRSGEADPAWPSPWGWGRPGWHAECTAMGLGVLGPAIDVLLGGADLAYPHHAYQAAMAEAATGVTPFARSHLLIGSVRIDGERMAKSTGNLVLVGDVLADHSPAAVRLLLLDRDWRAAWDYTPAALDAAAGRLDRLYAAAGRPASSPTGIAAATEALLDDLDVPRALAVAEETGGSVARFVLGTLRLTD